MGERNRLAWPRPATTGHDRSMNVAARWREVPLARAVAPSRAGSQPTLARESWPVALALAALAVAIPLGVERRTLVR